MINRFSILIAVLLFPLPLAVGQPLPAHADPSQDTFEAPLESDARIEASIHNLKVGENDLVIKISDTSGAIISDVNVELEVAMTNMDMGRSHPKITKNPDGTYSATVLFSMAGPWRVTVRATIEGKAVEKSFDFQPGSTDAEGSGSSMEGRFGPWMMNREASGTSWIPDSSPMFMKMLPKAGAYDLSAMGFVTFNFSDAGGPRGGSRFYSNSMLMLMGSRRTGGGTLGFSVMASADPIFNGRYGYPNLFQTGETAYGQPLVDFQHPHDLLAEVAVSYSHPISKDHNAFLYAAPVGEPALGGPTFMHRPSGMEIPEAPISHHWFDSTHISWGVVTAGVNSKTWQVEASLFNGHEPDENRYSPDPLSLNSASARVSFNPNRQLSLNASYGYLNSPESTEPGVDQHRLTAAALWSQPLGERDNLSLALAFGRNLHEGHKSDALIAEGTLLRGKDSFFGRWENVDKDELVGVPEGSYKINKFLLGGVKHLGSKDGYDMGLGAYVGLYAFPESLKSAYGSSPVTLGVFLRIRPGRM